MKIKILLCAITLELLACGTVIPQAPAVWQCAYSVKFKKFRCVNTLNMQAVDVSTDSIAMEAAQCLMADDFKKTAAWVDSVKEMAQRRCH